MARLIDRIIRDPKAEREDVMVFPTHIVTRQSTDIYANNDPHIAEVLKYIRSYRSRAACWRPGSRRAWARRSTTISFRSGSKR